jgi:hypothetical protein
MSFNSPVVETNRVLKPEKDFSASPVVASNVKLNITLASPKKCSPLASSTPFCLTTTPKFVFPTTVTLREEDPFDLVERKAQRNGDPWEIVEAEAAKFATISEETSSTSSNSNSNSQSLNKGFMEDSKNKTGESLNGKENTIMAEAKAVTPVEKGNVIN